MIDSMINKIITEINQDWNLEPAVTKNLTWEQTIEFVNFYDLVTSFLANKEDQVHWVNTAQFGYKLSLIEVIKNSPEELKNINQHIERLLNP